MNFQILHDGMGWPKGCVIPRDMFPGDPKGHIIIGAIKETNLPVTVGCDPLPETPRELEAVASQNVQLKARISELEGRVAGLLEEKAVQQKELERLTREHDSHKEMLDQLTATQPQA